MYKLRGRMFSFFSCAEVRYKNQCPIWEWCICRESGVLTRESRNCQSWNDVIKEKVTRNQAHFEMKNQWIPSNLATSLSLHFTCSTWILLLCKSVLHLNAIIDNHYSSQANVLLLNGEIAILRTTHDRLNLIFSTRRGGAIIWVTLLGDLIGGTPQTAFRKLKRRFKFP